MKLESIKTLFSKIRTRLYSLCLTASKRIKAFFSCDRKEIRASSILALVLFSLLILWALWLKFSVPFSILDTYLFLVKMNVWERFVFTLDFVNHSFNARGVIIDCILNAFAFAPFGVILNHIFPKKCVRRDLLICFSFSLFIELTQLFTIIGSFSVFDLFSNTLGYLLGFVAYRFVFSRLSDKATAWFYRVINVLMLCLLAYAVIATAKNIDVIIGVLTRRIP